MQDPELLPLLINWNADAAAARAGCKGRVSEAVAKAAAVAAVAEGAMCGRHPRAVARCCVLRLVRLLNSDHETQKVLYLSGRGANGSCAY